MLRTPILTETEYTILHLFCGLGGGALGFGRARAEHLGLRGKFRTLAGVDLDADACADFRRLTGAPATVADVAKMTCDELRKATRNESPDVVFLSPPCKGFSGLLPKARAEAEKYQALNRLVFQGLFLVLETWPGALPGLIVLENVPRIRQRGAELLMNVKGLLGARGYRFHESTHNCGELGGLSQNRNRYLLVARLPAKVPTYVYHPPKLKVRSIGEALESMPMPDDPKGGPMHRLPRLEWRTWERLALIPAGGDWRDLEPEEDGSWGGGAYGVVPWTEPSATVTGNGRPASGAFTVADRRVAEAGPRFNNVYRVTKWKEPAGAVTSGTGPSSSGVCVGDPRLSEAEGRHHNKFRVEKWTKPAHVVTGSDRVGSGAPSVGDPRIGNWKDKPGLMGVAKWDEPSPVVNGTMKVSGGNSVASVADPLVRKGRSKRASNYGVMGWHETAGAVVGAADVAQGRAAVADPRRTRRNGTLGVGEWGAPSTTVTGEAYPTTGTFSVADPRLPDPDHRPETAPLIIALDGTWHRPLTTLELARLQDLPVFDKKGRPLVLAGKSQARWRERIGNAVPPSTAEAMGKAFLGALLGAGAKAGAGFSLSSGDVWVRPGALEREARRAVA